MTSSYLFVDIETTGLSLADDEVWEVAAIRRDVRGVEAEHHWFLRHDGERARRLPEPFLGDYLARFDARHAVGRAQFVDEFGELCVDKPHLVGCNVAFDAYRIERILDARGRRAPWHYHLIDVEAAMLGQLSLARDIGANEVPDDLVPWKSDALAELLGVASPEGRHTAMVDARWARDIFDALEIAK